MISKGNKQKKKVDSSTRVMLIRKGNEFFTDGNIPAAEKIFTTVDYKDGLVRLGDYYLEHNDVYKACEMYFASENSQKIQAFCEKAAKIIQNLLQEDDAYNKIIINKKGDIE